MSDAWTCNASLGQAADHLGSGKRAAVFTHMKPDGDAIGSVVTIVRALAGSGVEARGVFTGTMPERFCTIYRAPAFLHAADQRAAEALLASEWFAGVDRVAVVDTGAWSQLADVRSYLEPRAEMATLIDHHAHGDAEVAAMRHIDTGAASASELCAQAASMILKVGGLGELPLDIATAAFLGMATDTGWFKHSSTTPATLRIAADLLAAGVEVPVIREMVEQGDSPARLWLMQRAMNALSLHADDRVAVLRLTLADYEAAVATPDDASGLVDIPMPVSRVRVCVLLSEMAGGITKVSMRSKSLPPDIDVNVIAQRFGGGGHVHAAGAKASGSIDEVAGELITMLEHAVREATPADYHARAITENRA